MGIWPDIFEGHYPQWFCLTCVLATASVLEGQIGHDSREVLGWAVTVFSASGPLCSLLLLSEIPISLHIHIGSVPSHIWGFDSSSERPSHHPFSTCLFSIPATWHQSWFAIALLLGWFTGFLYVCLPVRLLALWEHRCVLLSTLSPAPGSIPAIWVCPKRFLGFTFLISLKWGLFTVLCQFQARYSLQQHISYCSLCHTVGPCWLSVLYIVGCNCRLPGSSVHRILQARILEWMPCPLPGTLRDPGIKLPSLMSPALAGRLFTTSVTWEDHFNPKPLIYPSLVFPFGSHYFVFYDCESISAL